MKMRDMMVALVLFSVLVAGSATFYTNLFSNYNRASPENLSTMETVDTMEEKGTSLQNKVQSMSQMNLEGIFSFLAAIPNALSLLADVPVLAYQTIEGSIGAMPAEVVPGWAPTMFNVILIVIGVMILISAIQKYKM